MPSLDEVYRKFGETAEAAQLLETELGTMLLTLRATKEDLFSQQDTALARSILDSINRSTLGQMLWRLGPSIRTAQDLEELLSDALAARNRLTHSFYREHNFRRNTDEGRAIMIGDLNSIHETILRAYQATLAMSGIDIDKVDYNPPTQHLPT